MADKRYKSEYSGEQIDEAITKINALEINNYYNKNEVKELLDQEIGSSFADYYTKNEIDVQGRFEDDSPTAKFAAGGITVGTELAGLSLKTILKMIFYGKSEIPTLTEPKFTSTIAGDLFGISGAKLSVKGVLKFDQGAIEPPFGTNGKRAGAPYQYRVGDQAIETSENEIDFAYEVAKLNPDENNILIEVYYSDGEQPLDSLGAPYQEPLKGGVLSNTIIVIGLTSSFSGVDGKELTENKVSERLIPIESEEYADSGLFGKDNKIYGYQIKTPAAESFDDRQIVLIPENVTLKGIKAWNVMGNDWQWFCGENSKETLEANAWIKSEELVVKEIDGISVKYQEFKYNANEYGLMDENYFRFYLTEEE